MFSSSFTWSDEFDGPAVNTSIWTFEVGDGSQYGITGWGNQESQWYEASSATVRGGILQITAAKDASGRYSSARMKTHKNFDYRYGTLSVRARVPSAVGTWAAIWLLP